MDDMESVTGTVNLTLSSTLNSTFSPTLNSNQSLPVLPDLHHPLPTIIVTVCLFLLFGGCVTLLASCRCSGRCRAFSGESDPDGQTSPGEPQLKLWKRLGSGRYPFSSVSSFRRSPRSALTKSKLSLRLEQDRNDLQAQLSIPCLLQYATEI